MSPPIVLLVLCPPTSTLSPNNVHRILVFCQPCPMLPPAFVLVVHAMATRVGGGALVFIVHTRHSCPKFLPLPHWVLYNATTLLAPVRVASKRGFVLPWLCGSHVFLFPHAATPWIFIQCKYELHRVIIVIASVEHPNQREKLEVCCHL